MVDSFLNLHAADQDLNRKSVVGRSVASCALWWSNRKLTICGAVESSLQADHPFLVHFFNDGRVWVS